MSLTRRLAEWLLVPAAIGALVLFFQGSAPVEERPQLLRLAGQDVTLRADNANAFARFHPHPNGMELHVLVHEEGEEGELFRTRVVLVDGQAFQVRVGQEDGDVRAEFSFIRSGDEILAAVFGPGAERSYASQGWLRGFL